MNEITYLIPISLVIVFSIVSFFQSFDKKNKSVMYIYFGFFEMCIIVLSLTLLFKANGEEKLLNFFVKTMYAFFLIMPFLLTYGLNKIFFKNTKYSKKEKIIFLSAIIIFISVFFFRISFNEKNTVYSIYSIFFIIYFLINFIILKLKVKNDLQMVKENNHKEYKVLSNLTLNFFLFMILIELIHQLIQIPQEVHQIATLLFLITVFYYFFKHKIFEINQRIQILTVMVISLFLISAIYYVSADSEKELKMNTLHHFSEVYTLELDYLSEKIKNYEIKNVDEIKKENINLNKFSEFYSMFFVIDGNGTIIYFEKTENGFEEKNTKQNLDFVPPQILDDFNRYKDKGIGSEIFTNLKGEEILVNYKKVESKELVIGSSVPINILLSKNEEVFRKTRNVTFVAVLFTLMGFTGIIFTYSKYNLNLEKEVQKKAEEIKTEEERHRNEAEKNALDLQIINKNLSEKIVEAEETKNKANFLSNSLKKTNEELKSLANLKDDFMNISSHELKTPLISIIGYAELLKKKEYIPENDKKMLEILWKNSIRLKKLVGNILTISKLESGKIELKKTKFDLWELVKESLEEVSGIALQKKIQINVQKKGDTTLSGDKGLLSHIFPNLIGNAVKFTPEGGKVDVELVEIGDNIKGIVSDTGVGIPEKLINNLFQKFYQIDSARDRKYGGSGLGLSICKEIIKVHDGKIWVESQEGKGSTFIFEIPKL